MRHLQFRLVPLLGLLLLAGCSGQDTIRYYAAAPTPGAPSISGPGNQFVVRNATSVAVPLQVSDPVDSAAVLTLGAYSDNPVLLPPAGIQFGGSGSGRTVTFAPQAGATGYAQVVLTVKDTRGFTASLPLTVSVGDGLVTSLADSGAGSLRAAIAAAPAGGVIVFDPALASPAHPATVALASELLVQQDLTLLGPGANALTLSGQDNVRVLDVTAGNLTLEDLAITHGRVAGDDGGAVLFLPPDPSILRIRRCLFQDNQSNHASNGPTPTGGNGGAIRTYGNLDVQDSTFAQNSCQDTGGAIFLANGSAVVSATNCTFTGNHADVWGGALLVGRTFVLRQCTLVGNSAQYGGGLLSLGATVDLGSSIIAGNTATAAGPDLNVNALNLVQSRGSNLIGIGDNTNAPVTFAPSDVVGTSATPVDPLVDVLGAYGGPTPTLRLKATSPALHLVPAASLASPLDQRGTFRRAHGTVNSDAGAFERQPTDQ